MGGAAKAIKKVVKSVVKAVVGVVKSVVNFVGDVVGFVFSPFGAFDTPPVPDPGQAAQGVTVSKTGTNNPLPVVYGYRRVGGNIVFAESNGTSNKYLYIVYAICEGEIHGVRKLIVNDVELPTQGSVHTPETVYTVSSGRFKNRMQYQIFNGTETQGQSSLANQTPNWPKKRRRLPGIAYVVCRFEWKEIKSQADADNNPYAGGIPNVSFDIYGKKVYDVRTHGSGKDLSGTYASRTKRYNFNPANCLLDYLENPRYGAGLPASEIDAEAFKIAANKYEQTVQYSNKQSGRAMTMNAVVPTSQKVFDNIKTLVAGARGIMPFVEGRYKLKVEDGGHPTDIASTTVTSAYDVTSENIVGGITIDGERKDAKYNQVIINYIDPDKNFTNQQVVYNVNGDQTIDNDEELNGEFTFHTLTNPAIARDLAQMIYDKSRVQRQISFLGTQELLAVEVGDIIRVTDTILNLNQQTFRVTGLKLNNDGNISIDGVEHDATLYPFTSGPQIELDAPLFIPDDYTIIPYTKPLPPVPTSTTPPLDPDVDSAGEPVEVNAPGEAPDAQNEPTGMTSFDDFSKSYAPSSNAFIWNGTLADGTFYFAGYTTTTYSTFFWEANGETSLIQYTNPIKYLHNDSADYYRMAVRKTYKQSFWNGSSYAYRTMDGFWLLGVVMPKDTRIDQLIIRTFGANGLVNERKIDIMDPDVGSAAQSRYNPDVKTRYDEYTGILRIPSNVVVNFDGSDETFRHTVRWAQKRTGEEWEDASDLSNGGFTDYSYQLPSGIFVRKNNLEAYYNFLFEKYHEELAAAGNTGTSVSQTQNLGG